MLSTWAPKDVLMRDRNFCVRNFLHGIAAQDADFVTRQHPGLPWQADGEERFVGLSESGPLFEQEILVSDRDGNPRRFRRLRIALKQATRDGDKELRLLTNLPASVADAFHIAQRYRKRWRIETAFQELEAHLPSEINALGYPQAALFGFCVAWLAYNLLAVVKAALRSVHGEEKIANEVSGYDVAGHLARTYDGMMIAIPTEEWRIFQDMSSPCFIAILQQLARKVDLAKFRKHQRAPKKPDKSELTIQSSPTYQPPSCSRLRKTP